MVRLHVHEELLEELAEKSIVHLLLAVLCNVVVGLLG